MYQLINPWQHQTINHLSTIQLIASYKINQLTSQSTDTPLHRVQYSSTRNQCTSINQSANQSIIQSVTNWSINGWSTINWQATNHWLTSQLINRPIHQSSTNQSTDTTAQQEQHSPRKPTNHCAPTNQSTINWPVHQSIKSADQSTNQQMPLSREQDTHQQSQ